MKSVMRSVNRQKILILLLLVSLVISLAACGSDSQDSGTQVSPSTPASPPITETPQSEVKPTLSPTPTQTSKTPQIEPEPTVTQKPTPTPTPTAALIPAVSLSDVGNYYKVVLDYTGGKDPYEMMAEYGQTLSDRLPGIQEAIDRFLYNLIDDGIDMYLEILEMEVPEGMERLFDLFALDFVFATLVDRMEDVLPQLPQQYVAELEGLASTLPNSDKTKLGDGKLSAEEVRFYNIFPDVSRVYQCSAIAVFDSLSESGRTIVGRNFDLEANVENYGSITEIRNSDPAHSVYLIGWLGNLNAYTGFSDKGIFGALVDTTGSMKPYTSEGIHSYIFDLRYALENRSSIEGVAEYMSQPPYAFNHLIFLADSEKSQILENNISGTGSNMQRRLRSSDSELNPGIDWDISDAVVAVSAFMLEGNHDNFTNMGLATERLESYKMLIDQAKQNDGKIGWDEIRQIQSYDGPDNIPGDMENGDLYNYGTRRIVIFEPETFRLEVFFLNTPTPPKDPGEFDVIEVSF